MKGELKLIVEKETKDDPIAITLDDLKQLDIEKGIEITSVSILSEAEKKKKKTSVAINVISQ